MKLNAADWISIYRIAAAPVLGIAILADQKLLFAVLLMISLGSDIADGMVARWRHRETKHGAQLDSIGDALTFVAAVAGVWRFGKEFLMENYIAILIVVLPYAAQILVALIKYGKPSSFHTYLAKAAALLQGIFLLSLFFYEPVMWLFYAAVVVTVLEITEEIVLVFMLKEWKTDVKGLYWVMKQRNTAR